MTAWEGVSALAAEMGVSFKYKDESWMMKALGVILFFNKRFLSTYTTTLGSTIYFPNRAWVRDCPDDVALVVAHELTHVQDSRDQGQLAFAYSYLCPQVFALLSLLALLAPVLGWQMLLAVFNLAWLLPCIGSVGRSHIEFRGYATTMACLVWGGNALPSPPQWIMDQFTSSSYFWMDHDAGHVEGCLRGFLNRIAIGTIDDDLPLAPRLRKIFREAKPWA